MGVVAAGLKILNFYTGATLGLGSFAGSRGASRHLSASERHRDSSCWRSSSIWGWPRTCTPTRNGRKSARQIPTLTGLGWSYAELRMRSPSERIGETARPSWAVLLPLRPLQVEFSTPAARSAASSAGVSPSGWTARHTARNQAEPPSRVLPPGWSSRPPRPPRVALRPHPRLHPEAFSAPPGSSATAVEGDLRRLAGHNHGRADACLLTWAERVRTRGHACAEVSPLASRRRTAATTLRTGSLPVFAMFAVTDHCPFSMAACRSPGAQPGPDSASRLGPDLASPRPERCVGRRRPSPRSPERPPQLGRQEWAVGSYRLRWRRGCSGIALAVRVAAWSTAASGYDSARPSAYLTIR